MFSEYASRFLAQSQSRFSNFVQTENVENVNRIASDQYQPTKPLRSRKRPAQGHGNLYQASSHVPKFNLNSRYQRAPDAPLFYSALDEFREEDDEAERERETADFFALQRSRRVFAPRVEEGYETEGDGSVASSDNALEILNIQKGRVRGIKSSWNGGRKSSQIRGQPSGLEREDADTNSKPSDNVSHKGKEDMVDIGLESTSQGSKPLDDLTYEVQDEENPPAFQQFRCPPTTGTVKFPVNLEGGREVEMGISNTERLSSSMDLLPATITGFSTEPPKHDVFWGSLFLILLGTLFATFVLVWLRTAIPNRKLGDTMYTTLHSSFHLFAVDTLVSIVVSLVWLALLRSFMRPLVFLILLAFPLTLSACSIYSLTASYRGSAGGSSVQDKAMRCLSLAPGILALAWLYTIFNGRHVLHKAVSILEFACRILASNTALLGVGFATLSIVVIWTWIWLGMFTRVFLGGHLATSLSKFIIDATSWWLAIYFALMYIWTLSVISSIQRSTTAATVSQWYFHRNALPATTSRDVVTAALGHATSTLFGTICFSTLLSLMLRLPLLVFPRRLMSVVAMFARPLVSTSLVALTNPLTITYSAIHSRPLHISARGLSQMNLFAPQVPTTIPRPRPFSLRSRGSTPLLPYHLAKLLLHATRFIVTVALGFGGWVATAHTLSASIPEGEGSGIRGSAYAYAVGLLASFIGWGVLGAIEGVLTGIVDASLVCWGSEKAMAGGGAYCLEAGYLFGEGSERR